jgi:hypothetical protein
MCAHLVLQRRVLTEGSPLLAYASTSDTAMHCRGMYACQHSYIYIYIYIYFCAHKCAHVFMSHVDFFTCWTNTFRAGAEVIMRKLQSYQSYACIRNRCSHVLVSRQNWRITRHHKSYQHTLCWVVTIHTQIHGCSYIHPPKQTQEALTRHEEILTRHRQTRAIRTLSPRACSPRLFLYLGDDPPDTTPSSSLSRSLPLPEAHVPLMLDCQREGTSPCMHDS